jgi:hypothetical protein
MCGNAAVAAGVQEHMGPALADVDEPEVEHVELLKRVWGLDALACPTCKGRMTALAVLQEPTEIAQMHAASARVSAQQAADVLGRFSVTAKAPRVRVKAKPRSR